MTDLLQWGLDYVAWIQQYRNPIADIFMQHTTDLGGKHCIYLLPFLLWCFNFHFMVRVGSLFLLSFFINISFKDLLALPRPFDVNPAITLNREWGYGMPSGHSQNSAILWIMLAIRIAKRWFWFMALSIIFLIGFSRAYFGLHFPGDILGGWFLSAALLWINYFWGNQVIQWLNKQAFLLLIGSLWLLLTGLYLLYWLFNMPIMAGLFAISLGFAIGYLITFRFLDYNGAGNTWQRLLRSAAGLTVLIYYLKATSSFFPDVKNGKYYLILFVVNTIAGLWLTLGAPMFFSLLFLERRQSKSES
ncbi:phosphatase PAP2 family protein [Endozoicomonas sp. SCSIO W0465]|uniref:phosphatase PAP2 family protein n=1 Tax=Endozoicomonas sp. SCSIO W0465 TaxID=2918516 RepID=UPI002075DBAA|nr:phosphatase PAP2 family protein [Endozoicomonas sp. SCSIO W0465]USE37081.1 phosphatase PAP2 family protein [Endozoicomonas sp. SCSIO W0465]